MTGAKSNIWFTGFHSLFLIWYFNGKCLVYGASLLTCTVQYLSLLFHFPVCQNADFPLELQLCLAWKACGQHRSPNFSDCLPCNVVMKHEWAQVSQGSAWVPRSLWRIIITSIGHKYILIFIWESCLILDRRSFLLEIWYWLPTNKTEIRNSETVPTILPIWPLQLYSWHSFLP